MDFFEHQEVARRKTTRLVVLFVLAVLLTAAALYGIALFVGSIAFTSDPATWTVARHLTIALCAAAFVFVVVGGGSLYKISSLSAGGGDGVAEMLGGRILSPDSRDPLERRALNVVEEMAIASGTPVPRVYVLPAESGINAFAAGKSPADAVIGLTRGTLRRLSREELSGVVGHEFSHILNGDMKLNMRLMGLVHGILVIGLIGLYVLRSLRFAGRSRSKGGGQALLVILAIAVGLLVVGFVGYFFGSLIKAAVSRQREFLADASAVQFTRNPEGIAGALMQIATVDRGAEMHHPAAPGASHLYFGRGVYGFSQLFSTHPDILKRIRRILPRWDGKLPAPREEAKRKKPKPPPKPPPVSKRRAFATVVTAGVLDSIGRPTPKHVERAAELIAGLPEEIRDAAREPYGARAVIYLLLLSLEPEVRELQMTALRENAEAGAVRETERLLPHAAGIEPAALLPLIDLTLPALRTLSETQRDGFFLCAGVLIHADQKVDLREWMIRKVLERRLRPKIEDRVIPPRVRGYPLTAVDGSVAALLTFLARVGSRDADEARRAFAAGAEAAGLDELAPVEELSSSPTVLDAALEAIAAVRPPEKRRVIRAIGATIAYDRKVTVAEAELFRGVADALGVPVPPLLPGE